MTRSAHPQPALSQIVPTSRAEVTALITLARRLGLSYTEIAEALGTPPVWTAAALLAQHPVPAALAQHLCTLLELPGECAAILHEIPVRGSFEHCPPPIPRCTAL